MKRRRIKPMSDKRRRENDERREIAKELPEHCEASKAPEPCFGPLTTHEVLPRARGGSITDRENLKRVCAEHNRWLSQTVEGQRWGYANGLLKSRWRQA